MIRKANGSCITRRKALLSVICLAEAIIVAGGTAACGGRDSASMPRQEQSVSNETREEIAPEETQPDEGASNETQEEIAPPAETQPEQGVSDKTQEEIEPPAETQKEAAVPEKERKKKEQPQQNMDEQISVDDAKQAALADAGLSASDVTYTKEKSDYEDGIAVYDIEFFADNVEYEYEINAVTGAVYSKSVETHRTQAGHGHDEHGHNGQAGTSDTYIGDADAKAIALDHAGFVEAEVSRFKLEFDMDDGQAVYEVEFDKDGREYEYKIDAVDGSIVEYEVD